MLRHLAFAALVLCIVLFSFQVDAEASSVDGEIDLPSTVTALSYPGNETHVKVQGTFRVIVKSGPDQFLRLDGAITVEDGQWPAEVEPSIITDVQAGVDYEFAISFIVPAQTQDGTNSAYTVTLLLTNVLGAHQIVSSFRVIVTDQTGGGEDGGGTDVGDAIREFHWGLLVFIGGLIVFLALGIIWAIRNLELVREVGGQSRIMMREKSSGRILKRRYPPSR